MAVVSRWLAALGRALSACQPRRGRHWWDGLPDAPEPDEEAQAAMAAQRWPSYRRKGNPDEESESE